MLNRRSGTTNPLNAIAGLLVTVFVLVGLFYIAKFIFNILWWVAPIMFIASLIIEHRVFLNFLKWVRSLFSKNPLLGIAIAVLSVIAFPIFALYMLLRALLRKKAREIENEVIRRREGDVADYEEIDSQPLELPRRRPVERNRTIDTDYEDLL